MDNNNILTLQSSLSTINKTILKQLNVTSNTVFEIKTDGKSIILTPVSNRESNLKISENPKVQKAYQEVIEEYNEALEKLSKN